MRRKLLRRGLAFLAVALVTGALVIPYYRQLLFGPTYQGVPLCAWQDRIRRQTLGQDDGNWLAKMKKWVQPKNDPSSKVTLTRSDQIAIWTTLLDDPVPAMRVRAIQALWGSPWGSSKYLTHYLGRSIHYHRSTAVANVQVLSGWIESSSPSNVSTFGELLIISDGSWSNFNFDGHAREINPAPPVAPHLIRMLDDSTPEVRKAAFQALRTQGNEATAAFPRLWDLLDHNDAERRGQAMRTLNAIHPKTRPWLDRLIALLGDASADLRSGAASCLAEWSDRRMAIAAGPALVKLLRDPQATVRLQAASTLGSLGVHRREAIATLRACLRHADVQIRTGAINALLDPAAAAVYPDLVRLAQADPDQSVRSTAISALWLGGAQAIPLLASFLQNPQAPLRNAAVQTLYRLGPKARLAVPFLLADLEGFSSSGVQALGAIGGPDAVPKLIDLLDHRELRGHALSALQAIGPDARAAVPRLMEMLDEERNVSQQAFQALLAVAADDMKTLSALETRALADFVAGRGDAFLGPWRQAAAHLLVRDLVKRLETDPELSNRQSYVRQLGDLGPAARSAVPLLLRLAKDGDDDLRYRIVIALGNITAEAQQVVPWLVEQLQTHERAARAADALAQFGRCAESARPQLVQLLSSSTPEERTAAIWALSAVEAPEHLAKHLAPLLRDRDETIRTTALQALCAAAPPDDAIARVAPLLRDELESVRGKVPRALGDMGPPALAATPALCELLDDDSQTIVDAVLDALARIEP